MVKTKQFEAKLSDLIPTDKNPRQISKKDFDDLKKSLKEFPEMKSIREIVVDEDMRILGGHMRVKALQELGEKTAPVRQVFGLTDEQKDRFVLRDNVQNGEWDMDKLANEWDLDFIQDCGIDNIKKSIQDEKEIEEKPPQIVTSFITVEYNDEIALAIEDETAVKLMSEMIAYQEKNGKYDGFWDERLK